MTDLATEAVEASRTVQEPGTLAWSLLMLGKTHTHAGNLDGATTVLEEALALFRSCGGVWGEADTLGNLSSIARVQGLLKREAQLLAESLRLRRDSGLLVDIYYDLLRAAILAREREHFETATRLLAAEDAYLSSSGHIGWGPAVAQRQPTQQSLIDHLGAAEFRRAWTAGKALSTEQAISEALCLAETLAGATS